MKQNRRLTLSLIMAVLFLFLIAPLSAEEMTVKTILDRFEETIRIPNLKGVLTVKLIAANGDTREIEATAFQKQISANQISRLFIFDYPPSVRDTGMLIHSFMNGDDNVLWIYLPAVKRVKRIALAQSGGGYFMGSDFSYSDFIAKSRVGYTREYLGEGTLDGVSCFMMKEYGATEELRRLQGISYMINYYRKSDFLMVGRDYYDLAGELLKEYRVLEDLALQAPYIYPTLITMENKQTGHKSVIQVTDIETEDLSERYFTTRYLRNR